MSGTPDDSWTPSQLMERLSDDFDRLDDDEYVVVTNPKDKRTRHVLDKDDEPELVHDRVTSNVKGLCGVYEARGTSLLALCSSYDEVAEIMTVDEIDDDPRVCGNCQRFL